MLIFNIFKLSYEHTIFFIGENFFFWGEKNFFNFYFFMIFINNYIFCNIFVVKCCYFEFIVEFVCINFFVC